MKSLRKDVIIEYDQVESTKLEKDILLQADHPFLVGMSYVFQTDQKIFFVMRFVRGGELFMHLRQVTRFPEERARFYAIQVAMALGHLHSKNIIYRDLKPENILMDEDGYICLTDFGLAKVLEGNQMATSFCGTPDYLAPEILKETGHSFPVDWWALGILTYEMIVGFPPFYTGTSNNSKMYELIKKKSVYFPDQKRHNIPMSDNCKDFINKVSFLSNLPIFPLFCIFFESLLTESIMSTFLISYLIRKRRLDWVRRAESRRFWTTRGWTSSTNRR